MTDEEILQGKPFRRGSNINSEPYYHKNIVLKSMDLARQDTANEYEQKLSEAEAYSKKLFKLAVESEAKDKRIKELAAEIERLTAIVKVFEQNNSVEIAEGWINAKAEIERLKSANSIMAHQLKSEDIKHLQFIHDRLIEVHGENSNFDYMNKFQQIINEQALLQTEKETAQSKDSLPEPDFEEDEEDFQPCDHCDLPDACADFGCAIRAGIKQDPSI